VPENSDKSGDYEKGHLTKFVVKRLTFFGHGHGHGHVHEKYDN